MKALILDAENHTASVQEVPKPQPGPGEAVIRVEAIGLNPIDALYTFHPLGATGRTVGSDFAGVVVDVAPDVASLQPGQRVAGFLQGACSANDRPGAFAEFVVSPADLVWRVPDTMALTHASAISLCALTAAQALFYRLGLPAPFDFPSQNTPAHPRDSTETTVFIYGASTSVGLYAAQLVRQSSKATGSRVRLVGAASTARFALLRAAPYVYDALVDYRDPAWPAQVRALSGAEGDGVDYALDCISEGTTVQAVCGTLKAGGGRVAVVRSRAARAWTVDGDGELPTEPIYGAVWEGLGVDVQYNHGIVVPASEEARKFASAFYRWLESGGEVKVLASPVRLMPGGLGRVVQDGFTVLGAVGVGERKRAERTEAWMAPVSAEKLVYEIAVGE
ncbi:chaperonin 10-like protein [Podospora appendiculata]|uniref:Chaperonin 10-like protein n=1 Tax=Podospora appendiculata TaxID=314037 RepID=A0AAE0XIQ4_9PEZI|nr:chaperonin 10-like protein [Podospora appendiculata]